MIVFLDNVVPIACHSVVIVLRPIQLVVGKSQLVLGSPYWIGVGLIPKVNVRNVEIVCHQEVNLLDGIYNFSFFSNIEAKNGLPYIDFAI